MTIPRNLSFLAQGASSTGVLSVPYGGTGLTSLTANYIPYGNGTSAFSSSSNLQFNGTGMCVGTGSNGFSQIFNICAAVYAANASGGWRIGDTGNNYYTDYLFKTDASANPYIQTSVATHITSQYWYGGGNNNWRWFTNNTEQMRLWASGGLSLGNTTDPGATNLSVTGTGKFGTTIGVGAATPAASGAGITFPATPSASTDANTLDDYEEGTWTPSVGGLATYTLQDGNYVKIGRQVTCTGKLIINLIATGSATTVSGLPFTCQSTANGTTGKGVFGYFGSLATNVTSITIDVVNNTTTFTTACLTAAAGATSYSPNIFQNGTRIDFSLTYIASA